MKNKFVLLTVIMVSSLFYQCQKDWVETPKEEIKEAYFPHEIQDWGESFASNMNCATVEAKQKKMLKSADIFLQENTSVKKIDNFNASLLGFSKKQLQILACIIHKLSITMPNYLLNTDVLNKMDLKIIYYSLRPFSLRLSIFIGI